jgi:hypothetical protein
VATADLTWLGLAVVSLSCFPSLSRSLQILLLQGGRVTEKYVVRVSRLIGGQASHLLLRGWGVVKLSSSNTRNDWSRDVGI